MNDDINEYVPSILNPRTFRKTCGDLTLTQQSIVSRCSLSLKRRSLPVHLKKPANNKAKPTANKENCQNTVNNITEWPIEIERVTETAKTDNVSQNKQIAKSVKTAEGKGGSIGVSAIEDIRSKNSRYIPSSPSVYVDIFRHVNTTKSVVTISSATELDAKSISDDETAIYNVEQPSLKEDKSEFSISFGVIDCDSVDVTTRNVLIKNVSLTKLNNSLTVDCELIEASQASTYTSSCDENMNDIAATQYTNTGCNIAPYNPLKRPAVTVSLAIKKSKTTEEDEIDKILLLKTNSTDKVSHVIIQPPNCQFRKKNTIFDNKNKFKRHSSAKSVSTKNGLNASQKASGNLKQLSLDRFLKRDVVSGDSSKDTVFGLGHVSVCEIDELHAGQEMNRTLGVNDVLRFDGSVGRSAGHSPKKDVIGCRVSKLSASSRELVTSRMSSPNAPSRRESHGGEVPRCSSSRSPRQKAAEVHYPSPPTRMAASKLPVTPVKNIPLYKIVAGTHFAVDAFSYGDIPNVKHYFLTHFHSDHYSGLKKSFNKNLYCSKITADLCQSRLGVNSKYIHIINVDETKTVDGVEVTAVDANHCPGAIMLMFTLPNGKTILHTGDFRAHPSMESYPIFWNNDIHTVYLDTTYCNPRYDFPTQDESLEMALYLLKQKKMALEKVSKKFSSVLIVCGTYTIGKEKFFLGMARRIGCSVWACPEKERVLQAVEGRGCSGASPPACQLHVLPMRDITLEKLRQYLESLQGAFSEVVAFKPSGWENGKNATIEKECVTIYGIPYSEHSSFSEMIRFVKYLKPKQVVPTVDITGGIKSVQKFFPCPLVYKDNQSQCRMTDFFSIQGKQHGSAVT